MQTSALGLQSLALQVNQIGSEQRQALKRLTELARQQNDNSDSSNAEDTRVHCNELHASLENDSDGDMCSDENGSARKKQKHSHAKGIARQNVQKLGKNGSAGNCALEQAHQLLGDLEDSKASLADGMAQWQVQLNAVDKHSIDMDVKARSDLASIESELQQLQQKLQALRNDRCWPTICC